MRIAFYAPLKSPRHPVPSGDRRIGRQLLRALKLAGHDVRLASSFRAYEGAGDGTRQAALRRQGEATAQRLIRRYAAGAWRPDGWFTYHLYHKAPDWLGPAVSAALGIPYYIAEPSIAPTKARTRWPMGLEAAEAALRAAEHVFLLNGQDRGCVAPLMRGRGRLTRLLPFVDCAPWQAARTRRDATRRALARRHRLPMGEPWILAVAMMRPGDKLASYEVLADALARLKKHAWRLLIVGDGPARAQVRAALRPVARRIAWLGALPEARLPAVAAAADLFAWPAINEAVGMAILEAQAAGLPAVVGAAGAVPDIVAQGRTGFVVPAGDAGLFAAALLALIGNPVRGAALGAAAIAKTAALHDLPVAAAALDLVLRPRAEAAA